MCVCLLRFVYFVCLCSLIFFLCVCQGYPALPQPFLGYPWIPRILGTIQGCPYDDDSQYIMAGGILGLGLF